MEVYETIRSIGSGSFGQVYLVKHKREEKLYVIKKIKTRDMPQKDRENTEQEVRLLQKLRHCNIVGYKDSFMDQDQYLNIVMIHCEGGDMYNKVRAAKGKYFPETQILDWFAQMALALYYLHDKKILHRDLKSQNIFLKNGRVKLGDFGIAKVLDGTRDFANTCIGTPYYMSPELFKYKPYSYKSDIWALGCVMYEICNLRYPFDAQSFQGLAAKIIKGSFPPITPTYSKQLRDLIGKMLNLNPKERPTIIDILNKPIIRRRVLNFMVETFTEKFPEAQNPNDVDDIYPESLREQAIKLNLMGMVEECINNGGIVPPLKVENPKADNKENLGGGRKISNELKEVQQKVRKNKIELKKEMEEVKKIEAQIKKLESKKIAASKAPAISNGANKVDPRKRNESQDKAMKLNSDNRKEKAESLNSIDPPKDKRKEDAYIRIRSSKNSKDVKPKPLASKDNQAPGLGPRSPSMDEPKKKRDLSYKEIAKRPEPDFQRAPKKMSFDDRDLEPKGMRRMSSEPAKDLVGQCSFANISEVSTSIERSEFMDNKSKVLYEKERKKREEQERIENELKKIRIQNFEARKLAADKKNAFYRQSFAMPMSNSRRALESKRYGDNCSRDSLEDPYLIGNLSVDALDEKKREIQALEAELEALSHPQHRMKIQEDYEMGEEDERFAQDEQPVITEEFEENEDDSLEEQGKEIDLNLIEAKLTAYQEMRNLKNTKINELKHTLKQTRQMEKTLMRQSQMINMGRKDTKVDPLADQDIDEENKDDEIFDFELSEEDEEDSAEEVAENHEEEVVEKQVYNPQYYKFQDRIKLLRYRCEAGIGGNLFEKAYSIVKTNRDSQQTTDIKQQLIGLLGEENLGFWHMIDQILIFEELSQRLIN